MPMHLQPVIECQLADRTAVDPQEESRDHLDHDCTRQDQQVEVSSRSPDSKLFNRSYVERDPCKQNRKSEPHSYDRVDEAPMPAVLSNAIDWLSRPYGAGALTARFAASFFLSASSCARL